MTSSKLHFFRLPWTLSDSEMSLIFGHSSNKNFFFLFFSGYSGKISQMPVILTPLHFDRDPLQKQPSCRRSVVVRTFITSDFMTGIPAMPGNHIPEEVTLHLNLSINFVLSDHGY